MKLAVGLLCVAACATRPAPPPASARNAERTVTKQDEVAPARPVSGVARLTPDVVLATIRDRYIAGVERCYRRHLKRDGGARGVVVVSFAVDAAGRTRESDAHGVTDTVDECIEAQMTRWRFPVPKRHAEARFALGLELTI